MVYVVMMKKKTTARLCGFIENHPFEVVNCNVKAFILIEFTEIHARGLKTKFNLKTTANKT